MKLFYVFILNINLFVFADPDKIPKSLQNAGYKFDVYTVQTADNYILKHFRIYPRNSTGTEKVVLLGPGLGQSGEAYLRMGPDYSLAYNLADIGCEVWLLNFRGTSYSLGHTQFSSSNSKFWEFSFHEMGMFDLPASIDFILKESKQTSVYYVAYSETANAGFVMLSEKPEYNKKLKLMITIAPLAFGCHATSTNARLVGTAEKFGLLSLFVNFFNINLFFFLAPIQEFLGALSEIEWIGNLFNFIESILFKNNCKGKLITGFLANGDKEQLGSRQITHFAQLFSDCSFRPYKPFFEVAPKPYNLSNTAVDLYAILAERDDLCTPENFALLKNALPNGFKEVFNVNKSHSGIINCPDGSAELNNIVDSIISKM